MSIWFVFGLVALKKSNKQQKQKKLLVDFVVFDFVFDLFSSQKKERKKNYIYSSFQILKYKLT